MAFEREVLLYRSEARQEQLRTFWVMKAAHSTLAFTRGLVTVFSPVVQSRSRLDEYVLHARQFGNFSLCRWVAAQLVGDNFTRHRFPAGVISCAVRWYFRFQLSLCDIEELLFERGVIVMYAPKEVP
jgi:hypothetical protein